MSADNGVFIGIFPKGDSKEYRVIHAQAIENCDRETSGSYWKEKFELTNLYRALYYGDAKTFDKESDAKKYACELSKEYSFLEYGICYIEYDLPILSMTAEEARLKIDQYYEEYDEKY